MRVRQVHQLVVVAQICDGDWLCITPSTHPSCVEATRTKPSAEAGVADLLHGVGPSHVDIEFYTFCVVRWGRSWRHGHGAVVRCPDLHSSRSRLLNCAHQQYPPADVLLQLGKVDAGLWLRRVDRAHGFVLIG